MNITVWGGNIGSANTSNNRQELATGQYYDKQILNGISSIQVPAGLVALLYSKDRFEGDKAIVPAGDWSLVRGHHNLAPNLPSGFNDRTHSIKVMAADKIVIWSGNINVERNPYVSSKKLELGIGDHGESQLLPGISALQVPPGLEVELYEEDGFKGRMVKIPAGDWSLVPGHHNLAPIQPAGFNDRTHSLKVKKAP